MKLTNIAKTVMEKRYLRMKDDGSRETPDELLRRVAHTIAEVDRRYGATDEEVRQTEEAFYRMMDEQSFMPNSPTFTGAGTELGQLSACFVLPVEDSLEGIYGTMTKAALIHQTGGGTGFAFSRLRAQGSAVRRSGGVASGPLSFLRVYNASTDAVKQGGTRRGANMGILRVDHPDILDFISCKDDTSQITNFNISVAVTDEFMRRLEADDNYDLIDPSTNSVVGSLSARDVWNRIIEHAWRTGEPGVVFIDRMNLRNPNNHAETIEATNPCGEQPLPPYGSCNLGSINLANFVKNAYTDDARVDWDSLWRTARTATHFLDNVIDANRYPIPELAEKARKDRRIGLGVMGFAEMLAQLGLAYDSDEAVRLASEVMTFIKDAAVRQSIQLAHARGVYPEWFGSAWEGVDVGTRNATLTTVAPTGTISLFAAKSEHDVHGLYDIHGDGDVDTLTTLGMPCSGGIEPKFALAFTRNQAGETMVDVDAQFEYIARSEGWHSDELMRRVAERGTARGVEGVPERWQRIFATSHDIAPEWHVRMQAAFQGDDTTDVLSQPVDAAVSKTINFAHDASVEDVEKAFNLAWSLGCKGITAYRDGCRENQVLSVGVAQVTEAKKDDGDTRSTNDAYVKQLEEIDEFLDVAFGGEEPRTFAKRPDRVYGFTQKLRVPVGDALTKVYVTVNVDDDGRPFEVFVNANDAGIADIAQATGRLTTQLLRYGGTDDNVAQTCKHLRRGQSNLFSLPSQLARLVEEVSNKGVEFPHECECDVEDKEVDFSGLITMPTFEVKQANHLAPCPSCGENSVVRESGCAKCVNPECGWSKCG